MVATLKLTSSNNSKCRSFYIEINASLSREVEHQINVNLSFRNVLHWNIVGIQFIWSFRAYTLVDWLYIVNAVSSLSVTSELSDKVNQLFGDILGALPVVGGSGGEGNHFANLDAHNVERIVHSNLLTIGHLQRVEVTLVWYFVNCQKVETNYYKNLHLLGECFPRLNCSIRPMTSRMKCTNWSAAACLVSFPWEPFALTSVMRFVSAKDTKLSTVRVLSCIRFELQYSNRLMDLPFDFSSSTMARLSTG